MRGAEQRSNLYLSKFLWLSTRAPEQKQADQGVVVAKRGQESTPAVAQPLNRLNPSGRYTASDAFLVPEVRRRGLLVKHLFGSGLARNTLLL